MKQTHNSTGKEVPTIEHEIWNWILFYWESRGGDTSSNQKKERETTSSDTIKQQYPQRPFSNPSLRNLRRERERLFTQWRTHAQRNSSHTSAHITTIHTDTHTYLYLTLTLSLSPTHILCCCCPLSLSLSKPPSLQPGPPSSIP